MEDIGFCGRGVKTKCRIPAKHLSLSQNSPKVPKFRGVKLEIGGKIND